MALLNIRTDGDPILRKRSKEVKKIDDKILELINDMKETMEDAKGIGIAAPQVGKLKRIIIVDFISQEDEGPIAMINPEIIDEEGSAIDIEGCLSLPNFRASVERPDKIKLSYTNIDGQEEILEPEGYDARIVCHELDHLDGILFKDKYIDEYVLNEDGEYVKYD